jgi:hypothetical protein
LREVTLPFLLPAQSAAWNGLIDIANQFPDGWVLIGGQMVNLHCWERNAKSHRPTDDVDAVLDIRTEPTMLKKVTDFILEIGFTSAGRSPDGHEHRWIRGEAQIDLLLASGLGDRARSRKGALGGTTISTPGGQGALDRAQRVKIIHQGRAANINRPSLMGAMVMKSAAYDNTTDSYRVRHLTDLGVLANLVSAVDAEGFTIKNNERKRLLTALRDLKLNSGLINSIDGALDGVLRVELMLGSIR